MKNKKVGKGVSHPDDLGSAIVGVRRLAKELNLTKRHVQRLVEAGLPKAGRGEYPLEKCFLWYIRYLQKAIERRALSTEGGEKSLASVRLRRDRADAELKEIEVAKARREWVNVRDVEKSVSDLVLQVKARILGVPARVAPELLGLDNRVVAQSIVEKHLKEALTVLAKGGE